MLNPESTSMPDPDGEIAELEAAARERWGDKWTIETRRFADGTMRSHAFSVVLPGSDVHERERLFLRDDGEIHWDRVRIRDGRDVEIVAADDVPDHLQGEIIDDTDEERELRLTDDDLEATE